MTILCVGDGSDDGYEMASLFARIIDPRRVNKIHILLITWPPRNSPLWQKASSKWLEIDDLHEAMEAVTKRELERLRSTFEGHAESIETTSTDGEPVGVVIEQANLINADLILIAIAGEADVVHTAREVFAKSPVPVLVARGGNRDAYESH